MDFGIIALITGFLLILVGLWGILTQKNIVKIVIGFSIFNTGLHIVMVGTGYVKGNAAPIINENLLQKNIVNNIVDPVPQALVNCYCNWIRSYCVNACVYCEAL